MITTLLIALLFAPRPEPTGAPEPEDLLGPIVVENRARAEQRPRLALAIPATPTDALARWREHVRRDLELFDGYELRDVASDDAAWLAEADAGLAFVDTAEGPTVRVVSHNGRVRAELRPSGTSPLAAHQLTDAILEALTGCRGGFASRLALARTRDRAKQIVALDLDGQTRVASAPDEVAVAPAFDSEGRMFYAASRDRGRYRIVGEGGDGTRDLGGSIYGIAFAPDGRRGAVALASGRGVRVMVGDAQLRALRHAGPGELALHPAFGGDGTLAWVEEDRGLPRVRIGDRLVSSRGAAAAGPTFCPHPSRPRWVWSERVGKRWTLVVADAHGRALRRLGLGWGDARWPACSPDGRMLAFVSNGADRDPGVYVTNLDRFAPRRISALVGDSLRWSGRIAQEPSGSVRR